MKNVQDELMDETDKNEKEENPNISKVLKCKQSKYRQKVLKK